MIMTRRNSVIYDPINAGKVTGVDKYLNYEYAFSKRIIDFSNKKKIFFDVGAAYGHYSWLASKLYKQIFCFEGDKLELFYLKKNMKYCKNVHIFNHYLDDNFTLDIICDKLKIYPDIVKTDIEGYEIDLLSNATSLFKNKCCFLIEFHKRKILKNYGNTDTINKFFKTFEKNNYKLEFNNHHESSSLKNLGISDTKWTTKKPNLHNYAIFARPK